MPIFEPFIFHAMKKFILTVSGILLFSIVLLAITPPKAVKKAFDQKFPNATAVKWDKENAHEYEASFSWNGRQHSANFSDTGDWLETESAITFSQLPENIQAGFNALHKGANVKAAAKIETSNGETKYEIEVRQKRKTVEYFYNSEGKEIKN
jgi:uncharacterized membrane protein YkoI